MHKKYRKYIEEEVEDREIDLERDSIDEVWKNIQSILIGAAIIACGTSKIDSKQQKRNWWNGETKEEINIKKLKWKTYLTKKPQDSYHEYKHQRTKVS